MGGEGLSSFHFLVSFTLFLLLAACQPAPAPTSTLAPTANQIVVTLTPRATLPPEFAKAGAADHSIGAESAYLTITFYADFQCAACVDVARTLLILRQTYPDDVRVVFRHFPQKDHDKAILAAEAAEAASDQGKFWELHDLLFADQQTWASLPMTLFRDKLTEYAQRAGITDLATFNDTLNSDRYAALIDVTTREAQARNLQGVPALLFNDLPYNGRIDEYALDSYTRQRLLEKRWFKSQPELQIDLSKQYTATLVTEKGDIVIQLFPDKAPVAVNNFIFLARQGWYDNITWHFVVPGFSAQTGDPSGTGYGIAGYSIADEFDNGLTFDKPGVVAMALPLQDAGPNSTSSQFFITYAPMEPRTLYDGRYTIFGQVVEGMDVLSKLTPRNPFSDSGGLNPPPGDKLITVKITEGS
ncbi:MAG: peptidylprolyl isomerase [Anaerolineae bacterium]|nr:peptidylprolyl isomerase [Anaerolineae bacterium]